MAWVCNGQLLAVTGFDRLVDSSCFIIVCVLKMNAGCALIVSRYAGLPAGTSLVK